MKMGFGSDLKNSHDALLKLQDWELRLLETVKKFMALRIKSDKEYASTLQNLCNQIDKESTAHMNYVSNVSQTWLLMIQQTEQLSKIMKTHAEDLNSGPLHRLTMMIKDKQQVKKSYIGVHQQIEADMFKVTKTELEKLKTSYRQLIKEMNYAKEKYKEALAKVLFLLCLMYSCTTIPSWVISSHPDEYMITGFRRLWRRSEAGDLHSPHSKKTRSSASHVIISLMAWSS
ncbi:tyrosine-protein kinase Fer isoform X10 [Notamacropus eugenii]|uniref:tyrosine-protein kinase Fer isoform X10 n=1 Tax=Notamacropus eugenii TaxID=9315 RepID=UPI003B67D985